MTRSWNETTLPTLLSTYKLEDIFTADEFGLVYQCLPSKTYHLYGEKCSGGKNSKVRLTGMAAASAAGEKLEMFVLGKSKKPRCFKNVRQLPCQYRAQKKSWMAGVLFEEWVRNSTHPFELKAERLPFWLTIARSPWNQELHEHQLDFPAPKYNVCSSTNGPECNTKPQGQLPKESRSSLYQSSGKQQTASKD